MQFFRYKIQTIEDLETITDTGFVIGENYSDATRRLEEITTSPSGHNNLVSVEIYEVDSYEAGAILDTDILDIYEYEKKEGES